MLNIFLLLSVAIVDHKSPRNPAELALGSGRSSSGKGVSWNDAERSVSKKDSSISSARTTMRKLMTRLHFGERAGEVVGTYVARCRYG